MPSVFEKLRHSYLKPLETRTCRWSFSSSLSVPDYHSGLLSVTSNIKWTSFLPGPRNRAPNIAAFRHLGHERKGREPIIADSSKPRRVKTEPLTTDTQLPLWGTRQGLRLCDCGDLGLTLPGFGLPPLRGLNQAPRRHAPKTFPRNKTRNSNGPASR